MPLSEPTQTSTERQETEAPRMDEGLFEELFEGLDNLILEGDAPEKDRRSELYAIAASVFA